MTRVAFQFSRFMCIPMYTDLQKDVSTIAPMTVHLSSTLRDQPRSISIHLLDPFGSWRRHEFEPREAHKHRRRQHRRACLLMHVRHERELD